MILHTQLETIRPSITPSYNYADSDYLAGVSRGTSKRWLEGYSYPADDGSPMVYSKSLGEPLKVPRLLGAHDNDTCTRTGRAANPRSAS